MMLDIDSIVGKSVANARYAHGRNVQYPRRPWTKDEKAFLTRNASRLPLSEIADKLGRSRDAVRVKIFRWQIGRNVVADDELAARVVSEEYFGYSSKYITKLIQRGLFPARRLPWDGVDVNVTTKDDLFAWATTPANWVYFDVDKMVDAALKVAVTAAQAKWDDAWLHGKNTLAYVEATQGVAIRFSDVSRAVRIHGLTAVQWGGWHIKRSDVDAFDWSSIKRVKNTGGCDGFTQRRNGGTQ